MYFLRAYFILISLVFFAFSVNANSEAVYQFTNSDTFTVPWVNFSYFKDTLDTITINDLENAPDNFQFTPFPSGTPAVGFSSHTHWIRFTARNPYNYSVPANLLFDDANIYELVFYHVRPDTTVICTTGVRYPFHKRDINDIRFLFKSRFPAHSTSSIYLKCNGSTMGLPVRVTDPVTCQDILNTRNFYTGLVFGIIIFFGIAALYLAYVYHDKNYFSFALFILSYSFMLSVRDGLSFKYLWPSLPVLQQNALPITFTVASIFSIIFSIRFLCPNRKFKNAAMPGYGIVILWLVNIFITLICPIYVGGVLLNILILLTVIYVPLLAVLTHKYHDQESLFYFVIWSLFLFIIFVRTIIHTFAFQAPPAVMQLFHKGYNHHTGIVIVAVITSVAIGERLRKVRDERNKAQLETSILQQKTLELQLTNLQTRIQPHFLFNILNTIANLIVVNAEKAETALIELSEFYRSILKHVLYTTIRLDKEIDIVKQYLQLEKMRFGERLSFSLEIDETCKQVQIPAMAIQVLVENSLKHGIHPKLEGGTISVAVNRVGEQCIIVVDDTGNGLTSAKSNSGTGLISLRGRLDLAYSNNYSLAIIDKSSEHDSTESGVRVTLGIPLVPAVTIKNCGSKN